MGGVRERERRARQLGGSVNDLGTPEGSERDVDLLGWDLEPVVRERMDIEGGGRGTVTGLK